MTPENPKSPFMVTAEITTYNKLDYPFSVVQQTVRADTLEELKSQMEGVEAVTDGQSKDLGKKITVKFGPTMQLDAETGGYNLLIKEARKRVGLLARIFGRTSEIIPSVFPERE